MKYFASLCLLVFIAFLIAGKPALGQDSSGVVSDDFNSPNLNTSLWRFVNPLEDADLDLVGTHSFDAWLTIEVPAGIPHRVWEGGNEAPRLLQSANDTDFEIEVKFESAVTERYQLQGLVVEQDSVNLLRFDFYSNGINTYVFAATYVDLEPTTQTNGSIAGGSPLYMRVNRTGDRWTLSYSYDGESWTARVSFDHTLTVTAVGPFIGNSGGEDSPAFTGAIDYFFNTASPVSSEDHEAPVITSDPGTIAAVEQLYQYDLDAYGSPQPVYTLIESPPGMSIDSLSGLVTWTPGLTGDFNIAVKAVNSEGFDIQSFILFVVRVAPAITSSPITEAIVWLPYSYDVDATAGPLPIFDLTVAPEGMTIDSVSGQITWVPAAVGEFAVTVRAWNPEGQDTQSFSINVSDTTRPTVFIVSPASDGIFHSPPTLRIDLQDDLGLDRAYYQFDGCSGPWTELWSYNSGASDTIALWTVPDISEGGYAIHFKIADDYGNTNTDSCSMFWTFTYLGGTGCCVGLSGNVDGSVDDFVDIGDLTALVDYLFVSLEAPNCMEEANVDGDVAGLVDIGDLTALVDYLFITSSPPAACRQTVPGRLHTDK